jgi:glycosyltransferase involved in cell wall biosynthesis
MNKRVLQLVKYYEPSVGGMESVVKSIAEGVIENSNDKIFTILCNSNTVSFINLEDNRSDRLKIVRQVTPFIFRSQPLNFLNKLLRKELLNSDIVHHHYPFPTMELSLFLNLRYLHNKKFIITWHANITDSRWSWLESLYDVLLRKLLKRADFIVVTSPELFNNSGILMSYKDKVKIIPLSFSPVDYRSSSRHFFSNRPFELLFVGKLRKYKGVDFLLEAIATLDVKLTIVGNGEEQYRLLEKVEDLNIKGQVRFIHSASDKQLVEFYVKSDLFVLPSISEAEAFGVVQLEAMAYGLPVINTRLKSGVPFVSVNNSTGLTVEPKSVNELKVAIEKIINNKELYELFSINAIERASQFTRDKMSQDYLKLYD